MMRSLFAGVSGLKTHQTRMDVIGNNIANVNTVAYKSNSMVFSELMSQTTQRASGPNALTGTGGTNAKQIGLGVKGGAIYSNISTQGASQSTGNPFDIMISGDAFFVVNNGSENFFTRDGSFYLDGGGNLAMTSTGFNVMGWGVDEATGKIKQDTVSALRVMNTANMTYPPEATSQATVGGIIDMNNTDVTSAAGRSMNLNFYDALGYSYTARLNIKQSTATNQYSVELEKILDSTGKEIDISGVVLGSEGTKQAIAKSISLDSTLYSWNGNKLQATDGTVLADLAVVFADDGQLGTTAAAKEAQAALAKAYGFEGSEEEFFGLYKNMTYKDEAGTEQTGEFTVAQLFNNQRTFKKPDFTSDLTDTTESNLKFTTDGRKFDGTILTFNKDKGNFIGIGDSVTQSTVKLNLSVLGGKFSDITVDFSEATMFDNGGACTVGATAGEKKDGLGEGRKLGEMQDLIIQNNGMIYASYDNGMTKLLGQIAVAEFANASGLEKQGDNLYSSTMNSGAFDGVGSDITVSGGKMSSGQLEMSNVDLSAEFTEMITTQRGFQANSRIITVSDTLLEELTNLKR